MEALAQARAMASHHEDWVLWLDAQIRLLSEKRFTELDSKNLLGELVAMQNREVRALKSRLRILIMHLLKCEFQKSYPQNKWHATLIEQRERIRDILEDSPSLRRKLNDIIQKNYPHARKMAALETMLPLSTFPVENPYTSQQILDHAFMP